MEIERRWLIDNSLGNILSLNAKRFVDISQYYIVSTPEMSLRVRKITDYTNGNLSVQYFQTIKSGSGLSRTEIETEIGEKTFNNLKIVSLFCLSKTRSFLNSGELHITMELDKFTSKNLVGHHQIEIEFESEEEANNFIVPNWFGKEVTNDSRYLNVVLAEKGLPKEEN